MAIRAPDGAKKKNIQNSIQHCLQILKSILKTLKITWTAFIITDGKWWQMAKHTLLSYKLIKIYSESIEQYSENIKNNLKILKNISNCIHDDLADDTAQVAPATN